MIGGGPIGVLVALVARAAGADVVISEIDAYRREMATSLGLSTVDPRQGIWHVREEWTGGAGADVALEVSGSQPGLDSAVPALASVAVW